MSWQQEYRRALEKHDIEGVDIDDTILEAEHALRSIPLEYRVRLLNWLDEQSRDDFMVHGGAWEYLVAALFNVSQPK